MSEGGEASSHKGQIQLRVPTRRITESDHREFSYIARRQSVGAFDMADSNGYLGTILPFEPNSEC